MIVATKIVHIAFAAVWFGHKVLIPRDMRQSIHHPVDGGGFIRRIERAERLGIGSGLGTILSGIGLILLTTGFAGTPLRIYFGLAAAIAMVFVGGLVARPAWKEIREGIIDDDLPRAAAAERPFTRALMIENLLWIGALGAMVV